MQYSDFLFIHLTFVPHYFVLSYVLPYLHFAIIILLFFTHLSKVQQVFLTLIMVYGAKTYDKIVKEEDASIKGEHEKFGRNTNA